MSTKNTTYRSNRTRTMLIIIGIVVALILTWNSRDLLAASDIANPFLKPVTEKTSNQKPDLSRIQTIGMEKVVKFVSSKLSDFRN